MFFDGKSIEKKIVYLDLSRSLFLGGVLFADLTSIFFWLLSTTHLDGFMEFIKYLIFYICLQLQIEYWDLWPHECETKKSQNTKLA